MTSADDDKPRVHLVDATYELFRAFFGAPPKQNDRGQEVGATRGVAATLLYLVKTEGATHVGCATDHVIRSFRNQVWPTYKTDDGIAPELYSQFPIVEDLMAALGFVVWPMVEFEADDALATGVAKYASDASRVHIATVDKDLAQCVKGDHIVLDDRRRKTITNEDGVIAKFGVKPSQIPDYLALVGDSADGYPGIQGFGAKTAAAVLTAFGRIEDVPADPTRWPKGVRGAPALAQRLDDDRDVALLMRTVATLRFDVPLGDSLEDLRWKGPTPELDALCKKLGFPDMADRARAVAEEVLR